MGLGRVGASLGVFRGVRKVVLGWLGRGFGGFGKVSGDFWELERWGKIFGDLEGLERFGGVSRDFEGWNDFW